MPKATRIMVGDHGHYPYSEVVIWIFIANDLTLATQIADLKAQEPPRGASGSAAQLFHVTGGASTDLPCDDYFLWIDDSEAPDNGGTILRPTRSGEAWATGTPYAVGDYANNVGREYICRIAGTSGAAPGPTKDGPLDITDGTVVWKYLGPARWGRWMSITTCERAPT